MKSLIVDEPENLALLYYYALSSFLLRETEKCGEALDLLQKLYDMNSGPGHLLLFDYYKAKADSISSLLKKFVIQ